MLPIRYVRRLSTVVPGLPISAQAKSAAFLDVKLPDIPQDDPEPPVQIPYLPDFWDSATPPKPVLEEPILPKLSVVAGIESGGASHNLHHDHNHSEPLPIEIDAKQGQGQGRTGFWGDVTTKLGLPHPKELKQTYSKLLD